MTLALHEDPCSEPAAEMSEDQLLALEAAEEAILATPPQTLAEAARVVAALIENVGERTDGLDRLALRNLLSFLGSRDADPKRLRGSAALDGSAPR